MGKLTASVLTDQGWGSQQAFDDVWSFHFGHFLHDSSSVKFWQDALTTACIRCNVISVTREEIVEAFQWKSGGGVLKPESIDVVLCELLQTGSAVDATKFTQDQSWVGWSVGAVGTALSWTAGAVGLSRSHSLGHETDKFPAKQRVVITAAVDALAVAACRRMDKDSLHGKVLTTDEFATMANVPIRSPDSEILLSWLQKCGAVAVVTAPGGEKGVKIGPSLDSSAPLQPLPVKQRLVPHPDDATLLQLATCIAKVESDINRVEATMKSLQVKAQANKSNRQLGFSCLTRAKSLKEVVARNYVAVGKLHALKDRLEEPVCDPAVLAAMKQGAAAVKDLAARTVPIAAEVAESMEDAAAAVEDLDNAMDSVYNATSDMGGGAATDEELERMLAELEDESADNGAAGNTTTTETPTGTATVSALAPCPAPVAAPVPAPTHVSGPATAALVSTEEAELAARLEALMAADTLDAGADTSDVTARLEAEPVT